MFYGGASCTNCSDPLFSRQSCHFKKWSNIINGGHQGLTFCSNSPVPRPSHHYGGPGSIKIQSLLWLVWLRRASAQRRSSDPLLPLPECPLRPVLGSGLRLSSQALANAEWLQNVGLFNVIFFLVFFQEYHDIDSYCMKMFRFIFLFMLNLKVSFSDYPLTFSTLEVEYNKNHCA